MLTILTTQEREVFKSTPVFNTKERNFFFKIPLILFDEMKSLNKDTNNILFILNYGYFKATNKFYININDSQKDIEYISNIYNLKYDNLNNISIRNIQRYQQKIKEYFQVNNYTEEMKNRLQDEAIRRANNFEHRKKIFYSLVQLSIKLNIEMPSYTELTKIVTIALNMQKNDILEKLTLFKNDKKLSELDEFLEKDSDNTKRYNLSYYKKMEHSTAKNKMLLSLGKFKTIKTKFEINKEIIEKIGLTPKIAKYNSKWIEKSKSTQLLQTSKINQYFSLLAFVYHQYLIRNDNLIDRLISVVQTAKNSSLRDQKDYSFQQEPLKNKKIQSLESSINCIEEIIDSSEINYEEKINEIKKLLKESKLNVHNQQLKKLALSNKFDFIEKKSIALQGKVTGIIKSIEFNEKTSDKNIMEAIKYFKNSVTITNKAPSDFLTEEEKNVVFDKNKFRVSLYKVLLFFYISDHIKRGTLNLNYSLKYKDIEELMIDKEIFKKEQDNLLKVHEMEYLKEFDSFIEPIKEKLASSYKHTNENIKNNLNPYFTATETSYIIKTPKVDKEDEDESIKRYLPHSQYISVIDILNSINNQVDIFSSFQHFSQGKTKIDNNLISAAILGYGCNLSLSKIGKISKGINENQLDNVKVWYFSEENTIEANDKIIKYMDGLEVVKLFRHNQDINHTSSDGQKFNMASGVHSTNAGFSFKYFGTEKGVSVYTFSDESHIFFHSTVINVSDRESGYVIDGLLQNETIKSSIHSTDTHGFTEIVFGLTHLLGFGFGPRIKNIQKQQLYSFLSPKVYKDLNYKLSSKRKINEDLIRENWDDILRFVITIKEKKTTATQLLKRLTSYTNNHKLYRAIKEFGKIIKTDFILNYIDDVKSRQRIEKQLNKIEAANKFSRAVFFGNNGEFTVSTAEEQNIANNSKRLIQNAIILWNYLYITKKIQQAKTQIEKDEIIRAMKNGSIVHWSHINFYGEYDFTRSYKKITHLIAIDEDKSVI